MTFDPWVAYSWIVFLERSGLVTGTCFLAAVLLIFFAQDLPPYRIPHTLWWHRVAGGLLFLSTLGWIVLASAVGAHFLLCTYVAAPPATETDQQPRAPALPARKEHVRELHWS